MHFRIGIMVLVAALMLTEAVAAEDINKFINLENGIEKTVTVTHIFDGDTTFSLSGNSGAHHLILCL